MERKEANMQPAVSVIIPLYNASAYIGECIGSLQDQTFSDFEAIVIDDCSADDSLDAARRSAGDDGRFRILESSSNSGPSAVRNRGLEMARGTWVAFLDADDSYVPSALERMVSTAETNELDVLDFTCVPYYESEQLHEETPEDIYTRRTSIEGVHTGPELFTRYQQLKEYLCPACYHLIRRDVLERANLRFHEGILHEDELFSPLLHAHSRRALFLNEGLYLRRLHDSSRTTTKRGIRNVEAIFAVSQELYAWLQAHAQEYDDAFCRAFAQRIWELRRMMAEDVLHNCTADELVAFQETLDPVRQVDFSMYALQHAAWLEERTRELDEIYASRTYRAGDLFARAYRRARNIAVK